MFRHFQNGVSTPPHGHSKVPSRISLAFILIHIHPLGGKEYGVARMGDFNEIGLEVTHSPATNVIIVTSNAREAVQERETIDFLGGRGNI